MGATALGNGFAVTADHAHASINPFDGILGRDTFEEGNVVGLARGHDALAHVEHFRGQRIGQLPVAQ